MPTYAPTVNGTFVRVTLVFAGDMETLSSTGKVQLSTSGTASLVDRLDGVTREDVQYTTLKPGSIVLQINFFSSAVAVAAVSFVVNDANNGNPIVATVGGASYPSTFVTLDVLTNAPTAVTASPVAAPTASPTTLLLDPGVDTAAGKGIGSNAVPQASVALIVIGVLCLLVAVSVVVWQRHKMVSERVDLEMAVSPGGGPANVDGKGQTSGRPANHSRPNSRAHNRNHLPPPSADDPVSVDLDDEFDDGSSASSWAKRSANAYTADDVESSHAGPTHSTSGIAFPSPSYEMAVSPKRGREKKPANKKTDDDSVDLIRLTDLAWDASDSYGQSTGSSASGPMGPSSPSASTLASTLTGNDVIEATNRKNQVRLDTATP
jgi:hypothetical protein